MAAGVMILAWGVAIRTVLPAIRHLLGDRAAPDAPAPPPQRMASGPPGALLAIYALIFTQSFAWGGGIATLFPLYGGLELGLQVLQLVVELLYALGDRAHLVDLGG